MVVAVAWYLVIIKDKKKKKMSRKKVSEEIKRFQVTSFFYL